jgi:hypothetical protein
MYASHAHGHANARTYGHAYANGCPMWRTMCPSCQPMRTTVPTNLLQEALWIRNLPLTFDVKTTKLYNKTLKPFGFKYLPYLYIAFVLSKFRRAWKSYTMSAWRLFLST